MNLDIKDTEINNIMKEVAHQWKQPLSQINSIVFALDELLYEKGIDDEEINKKLAELELLTQYMSKTIDGFSNKALNNDNIKIVKINDLILELNAMLMQNLKDNSIEFTKEIDETLVYKGDSNELLQAIVVIINNAKDILLERNVYSPKISIAVYKKDSTTIIEITDNGGGMTQKMMQKIFNVDYTTKHVSEGSGIGLNMAKRIIQEDLGGTLNVENYEKGVCFKILLFN